MEELPRLTSEKENTSMNQNKSSSTILQFFNATFQNAHGKIFYGMTNDYMFRAVLQSNNKVLRGLICSLLHLSEREVLSVEITNPIILGKSVESKEFRLDINILLNNRTLINLEIWILLYFRNVRNFMQHIN